MNSTLVKITEPKAQDVYLRYELSEDAAPFKNPDQPPHEFIQSLLNAELYNDAITFIAHAIPKREGVWWACLSCRDALPQVTDSETYLNGLTSAENWVINPTELHRRHAEKQAEEQGFELASSWAAIAAFWSQGSITPPDQPQVSAPDFLYAHAVSGAISLAATQFSPEEIPNKLQHYIAIGLDLAKGGKGRIPYSDSPLEGVLP